MVNLFQPPPSTRYDLQFRLAGIPVRVHPLFWLLTILLAASVNDVVFLLIWVVVVFLSILAHELGHALAMRMYGQDSEIVLHVAGGLTVPRSIRWRNQSTEVRFSPAQEIFVSFAGPLAGFLLAALIIAVVVAAGGSFFITRLVGIIPLPMALFPGGGIANTIVSAFLWINIFWGLMNLMPVIPLDGGNIMRQLVIKSNPWSGARTALLVSTVAGAILAVAGLLLLNSIFMALLFGFLAFQSYQLLQGRIYS